jgi:hypothetical protein
MYSFKILSLAQISSAHTALPNRHTRAKSDPNAAKNMINPEPPQSPLIHKRNLSEGAKDMMQEPVVKSSPLRNSIPVSASASSISTMATATPSLDTPSLSHLKIDTFSIDIKDIKTRLDNFLTSLQETSSQTVHHVKNLTACSSLYVGIKGHENLQKTAKETTVEEITFLTNAVDRYFTSSKIKTGEIAHIIACWINGVNISTCATNDNLSFINEQAQELWEDSHNLTKLKYVKNEDTFKLKLKAIQTSISSIKKDLMYIESEATKRYVDVTEAFAQALVEGFIKTLQTSSS